MVGVAAGRASDPPPLPRSQAQPCHIALLIERLDEADGPVDQIERALKLGEAALKTLTAVLFAALAEDSWAEASTLLTELGTAGLWLKCLRKLLRTPGVRGRREYTDRLIDWLTDQSPEWVSESMGEMAPLLAVLQVEVTPPRRPTACDVLHGMVEARNGRAHGGVAHVSSLRLAATSCLTIARRLVAEWPCPSWTWAIANEDGWWSAQTDQAAQITAPDALRAADRAGLFVWTPQQPPLQCRALLLAEADPPRILCLNTKPKVPNGVVTYIDYATDSRRKERLEVSASRKTRDRPEWLDESAPTPLVSLVGRESVISDIQRQLKLRRLVSVVGPSGLGKTSVATSVARSLESEFGGRILWSHCDRWPSGGDQLQATVFGAIRDRVQDRPTLLVLDSLEAALAPDARGAAVEGVRELCESQPALRVLVTTLVPLGIAGEGQYPLEPLGAAPQGEPVPLEDVATYPALALLLDRIRDVKPTYRITSTDAQALCNIAYSLGGHPLALELIGPQVGRRGATVVASDLAAGRLHGERSDGPARHRSVDAPVAYSLASLNESEQVILAMIAERGVLSWSLLLGTADRFGLDGELVEAAMAGLEWRRLASRADHGVLGPHAIIKEYLRSDPANQDRALRVLETEIELLQGWKRRGGVTPRACACDLCAAIDELTVERWVPRPDRIPRPGSIVGTRCRGRGCDRRGGGRGRDGWSRGA